MPNPVVPQPAPLIEAPDLGGFYSFTFENDIFGGTDRDYTNGVRFTYTSRRNDLPGWGRFARDTLGWLTSAQNWYVGYGLGQNIYTATDITDPNPPLGDRPYAGFLYGSVSVIADSGDRLDTIALDLGVVGPSSLAEETQKFVHSTLNMDEPLGWDTQLRDEPAFRLLYEQKRRYGGEIPLAFGLEADAIPHASVALGNVDTSAAAGLTLRLGANLDTSYGPPRVRPAVSGPAFFGGFGSFGWSLFASAEARAVGRNIFLEGNTFRDSRSVDPRRVIGDFSAGVSLQWQDVELTYTQVLRTPEYFGQDDPALFGSVNLRLRF
jgi:hypothetical protein